jgi:DNA-nicking Smr family endonuclease
LKKRPPHDEASDAEAFARAMADAKVVPLARKPHSRVRVTHPVRLPPIATRTSPPRGTDAEQDDDGTIEHAFAVNGVDRREIRKLRRGDYSPASRCDLHGLSADAASAAVTQFIDGCRRRHHRCVCIVHGRGLRSPGGVAILKRRVRALLRSHPAVLAYADAPRSDGGDGAVYVLLRQ